MDIKQCGFVIGIPLSLMVIYVSLRFGFPHLFPVSGLVGIGLGCAYVIARLLGNAFLPKNQHRFLMVFFRSLFLRLLGLVLLLAWLKEVTELNIPSLFGGFFLGYYVQSWVERSFSSG